MGWSPPRFGQDRQGVPAVAPWDVPPSVGTKRRKDRLRRRAIPCDGTRRVSGGRAYIELVARSPHTNVSFERSIPRSLPLASGVPQGGTPWVDSFPYFLANQEIGNARPLLSQRVPSHGMGRRRLPGKTSTNSNLQTKQKPSVHKGTKGNPSAVPPAIRLRQGALFVDNGTTRHTLLSVHAAAPGRKPSV